MPNQQCDRRRRALKALQLALEQDNDPKEALAIVDLYRTALRSFLADYDPFYWRYRWALAGVAIFVAAIWPSPFELIAGEHRKNNAISEIREIVLSHCRTATSATFQMTGLGD